MTAFYILINSIGVALIAIINLVPYFKDKGKSTLSKLGWILFVFGFLLQLGANYNIQSKNANLKDELIISLKEHKALNLKYEQSNKKQEETTAKLQTITDVLFTYVNSSQKDEKYEKPSKNFPVNETKLKITYTEKEKLVNWKNVISGTVNNVNNKYYLVVHPVLGGDYYIQPDISIMSNGSWTGFAYFGRATNDFGKFFEVWLIENPKEKLLTGDAITNMPEAELYSNKVIFQRKPK